MEFIFLLVSESESLSAKVVKINFLFYFVL